MCYPFNSARGVFSGAQWVELRGYAFSIADITMPDIAKPRDTAEHAEGSMVVQTVIVSKDHADSESAARALAKGVVGRDPGTVDETSTSYRYRQRNPSDFDEDTFRTKELKPGVSIVIGKLKEHKASDPEESTLTRCPGVSITMGVSPVSSTWNQIAKAGEFKGHAMGSFEFNDKVYDEIIANLARNPNGKIHVDNEHLSETLAGNVAQSGAPAVAWITKLEKRPGKDGTELWAYFEWCSETAVEQVRNGQYLYLSPAINFSAVDPVSGEDIGARLSSVALTNDPYLQGMAELTASNRTTDNRNTMAKPDSTKTDLPDIPAIADAVAARLFRAGSPGKGALMSYPDKFETHEDAINMLENVLGLPELSTEEETIARWKKCIELTKGDPESDDTKRAMGVIESLRWQLRLPVLVTTAEVIAAIAKFLAFPHKDGTPVETAKMGLDVDSVHTPVPMGSADKPATVSTTTTGVTMSDEAKTLESLKAEHEALKAKHTPLSEHALKVHKMLVDGGHVDKEGEELQAFEKIEAAIKKLIDEHKSMSAAECARMEAECEADTMRAMSQHGLTPEQKPHLLALRKSNVAAFNALYPVKAPKPEQTLQSALLSTRIAPQGGAAPEAVAPPATLPDGTGGDPVDAEAVKMVEEAKTRGITLTYTDACMLASAKLANAHRNALIRAAQNG